MSVNTDIKEEAPNLIDLINEGFTSSIVQLDYAIKRVKGDDMSTRYIQNCIDSLRMLAQEIADAAGDDIDQYNEALELAQSRLEAQKLLQLDNDALREQNEILAGRAENLDKEIQEAVDTAVENHVVRIQQLEHADELLKNKITELRSQVETYALREKRISSRLRELEIMEPDKLKKKNAEAKKELRETRETLKSTSQKLNQQRITNSELSKNNSVLMAGLESARNEIEELQRRMQRANGKAAEYCYDTKKADGQPIRFTMHRFFRGSLIHQDPEDYPRYVNTLDFTYHILCTLGIGATVHLNEWLRPEYRIDPLVADVWPEGMYEDIQEMYRDDMATTHPHLLKRVDWANSVSLEDVEGIPAAVLKALHNHDTPFQNLRHVLMFSEPELAKVKGIGSKSAAMLHKVCRKLVDEWEKENGKLNVSFPPQGLQ